MELNRNNAYVRFVRDSSHRCDLLAPIHDCPHMILVREHWREDQTCKCDDPNEVVMREWGYTWDANLGRWS